MKYIFYTQNSFDISQSILLESKLNEYCGIKAYVDGAFKMIKIKFRKSKAGVPEINSLLSELKVQRLALNGKVLLEPYMLDLRISDIALKDSVDLNMFLSYAAGLLRKTKLSAKKPLLALVKDNEIKQIHVKKFNKIFGECLKGTIQNNNVALGTGKYLNEVFFNEEPRLYLAIENQTVGYIEFCCK